MEAPEESLPIRSNVQPMMGHSEIHTHAAANPQERLILGGVLDTGCWRLLVGYTPVVHAGNLLDVCFSGPFLYFLISLLYLGISSQISHADSNLCLK